MRCDESFFKQGFVQQIFRLSNAEVEFMRCDFNPYHVAKFIAIEIWGRLFVLQEPFEHVEEHSQGHLKMAMS